MPGRKLSVLVVVLAVAGDVVVQELLWRREGVGGALRRGIQLQRLGDVNGDGWDDLIELGETTAPYWQGVENPGLLWVYRGCPVGVRTFGLPDVASSAVPPRIGMRDPPGPEVAWTLSDAPAGVAAICVLGASNTSHAGLPLPAPLQLLRPVGWRGGRRAASAGTRRRAIAGVGKRTRPGFVRVARAGIDERPAHCDHLAIMRSGMRAAFFLTVLGASAVAAIAQQG